MSVRSWAARLFSARPRPGVVSGLFVHWLGGEVNMPGNECVGDCRCPECCWAAKPRALTCNGNRQPTRFASWAAASSWAIRRSRTVFPGESAFAPVQKSCSRRSSSTSIDSERPVQGVLRCGACPDEEPCADPCQVLFQAAYSMHDPPWRLSMATATIDGASVLPVRGKRLPTEAEWSGPPGVRRASTTPGAIAARLGVALHCDLPSFDRDFPHPREAIRRVGDRRRIAGGRAGMLTTVHHIMAGRARLYSTEPVTNPRGPVGQSRAARGNLHFYGSVLEPYNGVSYPLPAWERAIYSVGGLRCARPACSRE